MSQVTLEIGDIVVPVEVLYPFEQEYEELEGSNFQRTADGTGNLRTKWSGKLRTSVSARGWASSAFDNISAGQTHIIKCAAPRSASSNDETVTLPTERRTDSDHTPIGFAVTASGLAETTITGIVSNVATLTTVAGAIGYRVHYWPQITAVVLESNCRASSDGSSFSWRMTAEQV